MVAIEGYIIISGKRMVRQNGQTDSLEPAGARELQKRVLNGGFKAQISVTKVFQKYFKSTFFNCVGMHVFEETHY